MLLVSCDSDNADTGGTVLIDPPAETVETNPLLERTTTSTGGLELECVTVLYTFDLVDDANNTHAITSEQDFIDLLDDANLVIVDFVYPLDVEVDGVAQTLADIEALATAFAQCIPSTGFGTDQFPAYNVSDDNSCYELVFPLSVTEQDGSTTVINDGAAFDVAVADRLLFFAFPLQLEHEDGSIVSANDPEEMFNLLINCSDWGIDSTINISGVEFIACYTIEFPFDVVLADGTTVTVNDHQELCDLMLRGEIANYAFPMTLSLNDSTFTVADEMALALAIEDCPGFGGPNEGLDALLLFAGTQPVFGNGNTACWTVNYPIDVTDFDGNTTTIGDLTSFEDAISFGTAVHLVYPVSYTFIADGTTSTAAGVEDLLADIDNCQ